MFCVSKKSGEIFELVEEEKGVSTIRDLTDKKLYFIGSRFLIMVKEGSYTFQ